VEDAYAVAVSSPGGRLTVRFTPLSGKGLTGHRIYREDSTGALALVAEVPPTTAEVCDEHAALASLVAQTAGADGTLWWRVAGLTAESEGPLSRKSQQASTLALPDTVLMPVAEYMTGQAAVALHVEVRASAVPPAPGVEHFRYRFAGADWSEPILAGPLVLTGLLDGTHVVEIAAVDAAGNVDITPARAQFTYDFHVPEGTACNPAECNPGLACVEEPVGLFCRLLCDPSGLDGGSTCPLGTQCLAGAAQDAGACVAVAQIWEACMDRLCVDSLVCQDTGDMRALCAAPCAVDGGCPLPMSCVSVGCLNVVALDQACQAAACGSGLACEQGRETPKCRRVCQSTLECAGAEICEELGRGDLRVCR
jgi:hypothetical protein